MTLATSGTISFDDIVGEFGGQAPHSLSEYYDLAAQGVSGIPDGSDAANSVFGFGVFYGKAKEVVTSTWTPSSSTTTSSDWVNVGNVASSEAYATSHYYETNYAMNIGGTEYLNSSQVTFTNSHRYTRSTWISFDTDREGANGFYFARRDNWVTTTTTTDTSGYVDVNSIAVINT